MSAVSDLLRARLARGVASSTELQRALKISQATLSRAIAGLTSHIVRIGSGRSTRYALRRDLPQIGSSWPVVEIDSEGEPSALGTLHALSGGQYWFAASVAKQSDISDGLPFFLQDLWPQGFNGRTLPKRFSELGLPERISDWNDAHVLLYLSQRGEDAIGNVMIGDESLRRYLRRFQEAPANIDSRERGHQYPILADSAVAGAPAGSSAGGEHPKFTADVADHDVCRHVLVKFSPARTDRVSQRWSDLLIAEHVASKTLVEIGVPSAATELVVAGNRMFLEVDRFDRVGRRGRIGISSLAAVVDHYIGERRNWISAAESLKAAGKTSAQDVEAIRRAATFGRLIGNTDMHFGNLSFFLSLGRRLSLAPIYDMLPMMYAPAAGEELPDRSFETALPDAGNLSIWNSVAEAAEGYWRQVASHPLISAEFAVRALQNAETILRTRTSIPRHASRGA
jgi:hypothetical protein